MSEKRWALKKEAQDRILIQPNGPKPYYGDDLERVEVPEADESIVPHKLLLSSAEAHELAWNNGIKSRLRDYLPKPRPTLREAFLDHGWVGGEQFSAVCREAGIDPDERRPA